MILNLPTDLQLYSDLWRALTIDLDIFVASILLVSHFLDCRCSTTFDGGIAIVDIFFYLIASAFWGFYKDILKLCYRTVSQFHHWVALHRFDGAFAIRLVVPES